MTLLLSCFDDEGEAEGEGEALLADVGGAECWRTLGSLAAVAGAVAALGVVLLFYGLLSAAAVVAAVLWLLWPVLLLPSVWPLLVFIGGWLRLLWFGAEVWRSGLAPVRWALC